MSSKLQLTTLAVLVSAALPAQAALYKVVEVKEDPSGAIEYYGTAIQPGMTTDPKGCFVDSCADDAYALAGETRKWAEGVSYREEIPFAMDNSFYYVEDNDYDGFEDYCFAQLGYSTCESWAWNQWSGWSKELNNGTESNSIAFSEVGSVPSNGINTIINAFSKVSGSVSTIGNYSDSSSRNIPLSGNTLTDTVGNIWKQGRQWASDGTYTVGSVSSKTGVASNSSERYYYHSKPAVWNGSTLIAVNWAGGKADDDDVFAQGSMRDLYVDSTASIFYGVGYNNYNDQHMNATIFKGTTTDLTNIKSVLITNAQVDAGDDNTNTNSVATNINENLVAVGQAKRSGRYPQNGAAANRLFVVANVNSPKAHFLDSSNGSIFFNGAGGEMGGINNFNEIVGRIDVENNREYDGKQRRQRAFIYPYAPTEATRSAIFQNKAWIIDDLTNDGQVSGNNNQYRIYDASDINDAGVISATAVKCAGGYDSVASDSYCGNGNTKETVVAVKLVPIAGNDSSDIDERPLENSTIERQGGSLGFGAMTLLGLFGFMRKRIK